MMAEALSAGTDVVAVWWDWMRPMAVQSGLLLLGVLVADLMLRRRGWPRLRLLLWVAALVKLLLPPTLASPLALLQLGTESAAAPAPAGMSFHPALMTATGGLAGAAEASSPASWWIYALFAIWLAGALVMAAGLVRSRRQTARILSRASCTIPQDLRNEADRASTQAGLRRTPRILLSAEVASPLVTGLWRPAVVLPMDSGQRLSRFDLANVLLHEMCHVRRGDLWTRQAASLVLAVYWFQPLLHWAVRRIEQLCEVCCDATAAGLSGSDGEAYRRTLILHARQLLGMPRPPRALAGFASRPATLAERLRWLQRPPRSSPRVQRAACLGVSVLLALAVLPMADGPPQEQPTVAPTPLRGSLDPAQRVLQDAAQGGRPGCIRLKYAAMSLVGQSEKAAESQEP